VLRRGEDQAGAEHEQQRRGDPALPLGPRPHHARRAHEHRVVVLLTLRGRADLGLGAFVSSKINQWTLLVGGVPLAYGLSSAHAGAGFAPAMDLDARQVEELVLTATQGLYATITISDLRFSLREALIILFLFVLQLGGTMVLEATHAPRETLAHFHHGCSAIYVVLALAGLARRWGPLTERFRDSFRRGPAVPPPAAPPDRGGRGSPDESDA